LLNLFNTLTRKIEPFNHSKDTSVKMYTCGPSTYQRAHIGNYRTFIFEDILQRYLEYLGYKVTRLITLTDVEDKAISEAKKENLSVEELTSKNEAVFFQEFNLLKIKTPDFPVRASTAIDQAVELIIKLVDKGYAYWYTYEGEKNAYFDPLKFSSFGKLAHLDMSKWPKKKRRFHKDTYPGTPWNMGDFILWHSCKEEDVCWETKIGRGRPAWNIQDAAIVTKNLGFSIDIACGGIDNLVRHHDYTLAVAEAVSGREFCGCWLHGGHLFVDGEKMSKSKGNVFYLNDLLEKGFRSDHLRFFMVYSCYREKLDFTFQKFAETSRKLDSFKSMVVDIQNAKTNQSAKGIGELPNRIIGDFEANMNNDLNAKTAFDNLYQVISELHGLREKISATDKKDILINLKKVDSVLQCLF
jgi:cysteinyl-tRNA synthetase